MSTNSVLALTEEKFRGAERIFRCPDIHLAYLYGSYAKGAPGPDSDIDFAVLFSASVPEDKYWIRCSRLSRELGTMLCHPDVDVRELNGAPLTACYEVVATGQCVFTVTEDCRIGFEMDVTDGFFDFKPMSEEYDRFLIRRVKEGAYGLREQELAENVRRTLAEPGGS